MSSRCDCLSPRVRAPIPAAPGWIGVLVVLLAVSLSAQAGSVETTAGKKEGKLTVADGKVLLKPAKGAEESIPLDKISAVTFAPPATQPTTRKSGWQPVDIGDANGTPGQLKVTGDLFTIHDASKGLRTRKKGFDGLFFIHQLVRDDCTIIARVRVVEGKYARSGLMVRASVAPDAPFVMIARGGEDTTTLIRRPGVGADPESSAPLQQRIMGATWFKLERRGYTFAAFESADGVKWTAAGNAEIPMEEDVLVGIATAASSYSGGASRTLIDKVQLVAGEGSTPSRAPRGVLLKSGSVLAATIESADAAGVSVLLGQEKRSLPIANVAQCRFVPLLPAHEEKLRSAGIGVLTMNGDFLEGEFKGIDQNQVKITSVLFGAKSIDTLHQAVALNLRQPEPPAATFEVRLHDRSVLRAKSLKLMPGLVVIEEPILGEMKLAAERVASIQRVK